MKFEHIADSLLERNNAKYMTIDGIFITLLQEADVKQKT